MILVVGGEVFKTQKALIQHVCSIRDKYADLAPLDQGDFEFMLDLLRRHTAAEQKIGPGVESMYVDCDKVFGTTRHFCLRRTDGSETDFSFMECIKQPPPRRRFTEACRAAIRDDIIRYKQENFNGRCAVTGKEILYHKAHVDHAPPNIFDRVVDDFASFYGLDVTDKELVTETFDGDTGALFRDTNLVQAFRVFHSQRTSLRIVSKEVNLSLGYSHFGNACSDYTISGKEV